MELLPYIVIEKYLTSVNLGLKVSIGLTLLVILKAKNEIADPRA